MPVEVHRHRKNSYVTICNYRRTLRTHSRRPLLRMCQGLCDMIFRVVEYCCAAAFTMRENVSRESHADEFAAAQREHQEKCASLQKEVDDEKKSKSTDGLVIMILKSSGNICKRHISCFVLCSHLIRAFFTNKHLLLHSRAFGALHAGRPWALPVRL